MCVFLSRSTNLKLDTGTLGLKNFSGFLTRRAFAPNESQNWIRRDLEQGLYEAAERYVSFPQNLLTGCVVAKPNHSFFIFSKAEKLKFFKIKILPSQSEFLLMAAEACKPHSKSLKVPKERVDEMVKQMGGLSLT